MFDINKYKQAYLSEHSPYQFVWISADNSLLIKDSCNTIFDFSSKIGVSLIDIFPFLENLRDSIVEKEALFLPLVDISETDKPHLTGVFDFFFFVEEQLPNQPRICIIRDIKRSETNLFETQRLARITMLENEYLELQNKNIKLENTLLQLRNQELQKSRELKNLFFSKISHELRSPVNGILGLSQIILEQEKLNGELKNYVESIYTASKHLRIILDDILDISKLEAGNIEFQCYEFKLYTTFKHLKLNFLRALAQKKLFIDVHISSDVPAILLGDEVRLTQIFYNLISNAIKFTNEGGITIVVELIEKLDSQCRLRFCVSDTGIGMTEDELQRIFEPYEQIGAISYQDLGGTGLGLSVVKQLVEMQGGSIQVSSQKLKGTKFIIELPFTFQEKAQEKAKEVSLQFIGLSALIVDDSSINRLYTKKILQNLGFEVETCESGQVALEMLQKKYYDLLISDLSIPDLEGNVLVDIFDKQNPHTEKTSVIFATGSVDAQNLKHPVLLKPYRQEQLLNLLEELIPIEKTNLYSLEYLYKITEGKTDFIKDLIYSFLEACPKDMEEIMAFVAQKDANSLYRLVHKIKPMAVLMGSQVLTRIVSIIENLCKQTSVDWESVERYVFFAEKVAHLACQFFEKQINVFE